MRTEAKKDSMMRLETSYTWQHRRNPLHAVSSTVCLSSWTLVTDHASGKCAASAVRKSGSLARTSYVILLRLYDLQKQPVG